MIKTNDEFLNVLNDMLKKYDINVKIAEVPSFIPSFYSTLDKHIYINRYSEALFLKNGYLNLVVNLMKQKVKKINELKGIDDSVFNEETKRYDFNDNFYLTFQKIYNLYDSNEYTFNDFYNDKRNQNKINEIKANEINDRETYLEIIDYFYTNILIKGYPARAWDIISGIKPQIESILNRELTEFENDLLMEYTCNKTLSYTLIEIVESFYIKDSALYFNNEYLFGANEPQGLKLITNQKDFEKVLNNMLEKYEISVKLAELEQEKHIYFNYEDNEIYININNGLVFLDYKGLIETLINRKIMKINYNTGIKDHDYNDQNNIMNYNENLYKTRLDKYGIYYSPHNEIVYDSRNLKAIEKFKEYEKNDFETFKALKEYYYKNIIGIMNTPSEYGIYLRTEKLAEIMFGRQLTRQEKTYLESFVTFKCSYEPAVEVEKGFHVDWDGWLWHYYTRLFSSTGKSKKESNTKQR